jgi:hypothetical protein
MQSLDEDYLLDLHQLIVRSGSTLDSLQLPFEESLDLESFLRLNCEQLQELTLFHESHPNKHFLCFLLAHNDLLKQFLIADGSPALCPRLERLRLVDLPFDPILMHRSSRDEMRENMKPCLRVRLTCWRLTQPAKEHPQLTRLLDTLHNPSSTIWTMLRQLLLAQSPAIVGCFCLSFAIGQCTFTSKCFLSRPQVQQLYIHRLLSVTAIYRLKQLQDSHLV